MKLLAVTAAVLSLTGAASAAQQPGKIALHVGDEATVTLSGNPSTGYTWKILSVNRDILKLVGRKFVRSKKGGGVVGASGLYVFRFRALKAGTTTLRLVYLRPSSPKHFPSFVSISVTVTKPPAG
jgi:predicted secreted protein